MADLISSGSRNPPFRDANSRWLVTGSALSVHLSENSERQWPVKCCHLACQGIRLEQTIYLQGTMNLPVSSISEADNKGKAVISYEAQVEYVSRRICVTATPLGCIPRT